MTQTIPDLVVDNPHLDWDPVTNVVKLSTVKDFDAATPPDMKISNAPEPDTRYATLLSTFEAARKADPYSPLAPTLIDRRFNDDRQIPEAQVRAMLEAVLSSPLVPKVAALIESRLGRPLEPFDVWYDGFRPRGSNTEEQLDAIVRKRYPTRRGVQGGHPESARAPRLLEGEGRLPRGAHRRGPRARLGPRPRRRSGARTRPTCARASRRTA